MILHFQRKHFHLAYCDHRNQQNCTLKRIAKFMPTTLYLFNNAALLLKILIVTLILTSYCPSWFCSCSLGCLDLSILINQLSIVLISIVMVPVSMMTKMALCFDCFANQSFRFDQIISEDHLHPKLYYSFMRL